MTIKDFLENTPDMKNKRGESIRDVMAASTSIWSNDAARGYMIAAMQAAQISPEKIKQTLQELYWVFDEKTIAEAEQIYKEF